MKFITSSIIILGLSFSAFGQNDPAGVHTLKANSLSMGLFMKA
jgi:hypothetical protein